MVNKAFLISAISGIVFAGLGVRADEPSAEQIRQEIAQLQAQVSQLHAQQSLDQGAVAATIEQVLRDAEKRSQLMAAGESTAGYDNGFFIRSGEFTLKPGILFQFRNVTDYRTGIDGNKGDQIENGFEVRRLELSLEGTALTKDLLYKIFWSTDRNTGSVSLDDAYVRYMFADAWGVRAGQFKQFWSHEEAVSNGRGLAVERSLLDGVFGSGFSDRVQGATLVYGAQAKDNPINAEVGLTDGALSKNTDYIGHFPSDPQSFGHTTSPTGHAFDFGVVGRVEWKAMGEWANYVDFSGMNLKSNLLVFGAGFEWNQGGNGDEIAGTIDVEFKHTCGAGVYGAVIVHHVTDELSATGDSFTDWGLLLQASFLINPQWEPFLRWSMVKYDDEIALGTDTEDTFHEIAIGVNYYLGANGSAGHRAKVTVDLNWLPNGAPKPMTGQGYLGDSNGDSELVVRGQFQLTL